MNNSERPAYPLTSTPDIEEFNGLTVREKFVLAAMHGLCANPIQAEGLKEEDYVAAYAVRIADATLAELEK